MTTGAPDLATRDAQIAAAERDLDAAQSRGRTRPRRSRLDLILDRVRGFGAFGHGHAAAEPAKT